MSRDARRAAVRGVLAGCGLAALGSVGGVDPAWLLTCVSVALAIAGLAWLELREWSARSAAFMGPTIWALAALGFVLVPAHHWHLRGLLAGGTLQQTLADLQAMSGWFLAIVPVLIIAVAASCPFALVAEARRDGGLGRGPVTLFALLLHVPVGLLTYGVVTGFALGLLAALLLLHRLADRVEARLFAGGPASRAGWTELSARLPYRRLWLLAYLDHTRGVEPLVRGLLPAGRDAVEHAGVVVLRLMLPFLPAGGDGPPRAAVEALDGAPGDAAAALVEWPVEGPEAAAFCALVNALAFSPPLGLHQVAEAVAVAATALAVAMDDAAAVRDALRTELIEWATRQAAA
ncbi:MAG: hypothetical protein KF878_08975 [Planctomycetes bacterium]|nr:hypothetical protein [Planctomycetota bacterium]